MSVSIFDIYCSSHCLDSYGTCVSYSDSDSQCIVCGLSIYNQNPDVNTNKCVLKNQTQVKCLLCRFYL